METLGVQLLVMKKVGLINGVQLGRDKSTACQRTAVDSQGLLAALGSSDWVCGCEENAKLKDTYKIDWKIFSILMPKMKRHNSCIISIPRWDSPYN